MLEIAKSNGETSNNSVRLAAAVLAISVARLAAAALIVPVAAAPLKLATTIPLRRGACKAAGGCAASSAS
jgi:hypothetical protein